jgi:hypothetical protein
MGATNWFLIVSAPLILLSGDINFSLLILLPSSILIAHYYNIFKRSVWNEIMLLVFLAIVAAHNYLNL